MGEVLNSLYRNDLVMALAVFLLALAPRAALVLYFGDADPVYTDPFYQRMAENYAEGQGLGMPHVYEQAGRIYYRAFRPPLFPWLWGLAYPWIGGWYLPMRMAHAFLSSLTCVLVFFVGQRLLDRPSGLVGAGLCALYPAQVWHGVNLMTEPLFIFFLVLLVLLLLRVKARASEGNWVPTFCLALGAGVSAGLGVLSRSVLIGFIPLAALWLGFVLPKRRWLAAVFLAGFVCAMTPWWVRNWQVLHHFVLTTTDGGHGFLIGNNEKTLSDPRGVYVPETWEFLKDVIHDEVAIDRRLYEKGWAFIKEHPAMWLRLAVDKFCRFWRFWPHTDFVATKYAVLYGVSYCLVFPFMVAGVVLAWQAMPTHRPAFLLVHLLVIYMTGIHMIYIAVIRYREPLTPFLMCFAGYAALRLWPFYRKSAIGT